MKVAKLTITANYFYLLRRQAKYLNTDKMRPRVVMAPKSLRRNQLVSNPVDKFIDNHFREIIVEKHDKSKVRKVLLAHGKMAVDLLNYQKDNNPEEIVLIRVEQLYPFPGEEIKE